MKFTLDEEKTARDALDEAWRQLALIADKATEHKEEMGRHPERARDPEVELYTRWLDTFGPELAAIQAVHDAAPGLSADDLRVARSTAQTLLHAFDTVAEKRSATR